MKIDWHIDYKNNIASCTFMKVEIIKTDKKADELIQDFEGIKVLMGFTKIDTKNSFWCKVLEIQSDILIESKNNNNLLANFASQLGDKFDENLYK